MPMHAEEAVMMQSHVRAAIRLLSPIYARVFPAHFKRAHELAYWTGRARREGNLGNTHYTHFYTTFFDVEPSFYNDKRILDIGCGPRGSLEWAETAKERVGLDPLALKYMKLGAAKHRMTYVAASSDKIPFDDAHFDVVCSFNSLDHVDDVDQTISEIKRVTKPGGIFLVIVEVNHPPTATEPVVLPWDALERFADAFDTVSLRRYEIGNHDIYGQLQMDARFNEQDTTDRPGIVAAKLVRRPALA
jgi:SAM-dependent methyltransferase